MSNEYVHFNNNAQPAINEDNLNLMQQLIKADITGAVSGDTLPIGAFLPYSGATAPTNWLICDGSAISRTTYQDLFNVIGTVFGAGDGSTTFNLPDMRGRVPVGVDSNDTDFNAVGKTFGEKSHTLTIDEMPNHTHTPPENLPVVLHKKTENVAPTSWTTSGSGQDLLYDDASLTGMATGGGQAHNITQPSMATNYIIKAFQSAGVVAQVNNEYSTSTTNVYSANVVNGTTLYSNASGISDGSFTITDDIENYKRIKFFNIDGECVAEYQIFSAPQTAFNIFYANQGATNLFLYTARLNRNGRLLTFYSNKRTYFNGTTWSTDTSEIISIQKIVGYKY